MAEEQRQGPGYSLPMWLIFLGILVALLKVRLLEWTIGTTQGNRVIPFAITIYAVAGLMVAVGVVLFFRALLHPRPRK